MFSTVRMAVGNFSICATGFTGGGNGNFSMGDVIINTQGSSGNAQQDQDHPKMMGKEVEAMQEAKFNEWSMR